LPYQVHRSVEVGSGCRDSVCVRFLDRIRPNRSERNHKQVEVNKAPRDQGHYIHPELFGHEGEPSIAEIRHPRPQPLRQ
jgi:hypothetical protein